MPIAVARRRFSFSSTTATTVLRRRLCTSLCAASSDSRKSVVFLGSPSVAATVLKSLLRKTREPDASFDVAAVVSQPDRPVGRKNRGRPMPTPVSDLALERGYVPEETLLTPETARDEVFLEKIEALEPDLCITAAYGNLLPSRFLQVPRCGTLNIHPSLLPRYRGAAPVNRALEDGVEETGVTVAKTVLEMDAGPILASQSFSVDDAIQAPELCDKLFEIGTELLLKALPSVFDGTAVYKEQDPAHVSQAPKMEMAESVLHFQAPAQELHNKVRAFAPWPGTRGKFKILDTLSLKFDDLELRILETRVAPRAAYDFRQGVCFSNRDRSLMLQCGNDTVLEVLSVQKKGRKPMGIRDFKNGLTRRQILTLG